MLLKCICKTPVTYTFKVTVINYDSVYRLLYCDLFMYITIWLDFLDNP